MRVTVHTPEQHTFEVGWLALIQLAANAFGVEDVDVETFPGGKVKIVGRIPGVGSVSSSGSNLGEACGKFLDICLR